MMSRMLVLALALYGAAAAPFVEERGSTLDDPDCVASVPETADANTVNKVYLAALSRNVDMRVRLSMAFYTRRQLIRSSLAGHAGYL
jgi:hypothetical protein